MKLGIIGGGGAAVALLAALTRDSLAPGLVRGFDGVVLHGSGMYVAEPDRMPERSQVTEVHSAEDVAKAVL
ncbi:hypothetical protein [Streptosporangium pseudovulgare]|nr:hypothetical protein [Streptosporangium pseudovulgare]